MNLCLILEVWLSVFIIWKFYNLLSYIWSVHRLRSENLGALRLSCGRRIRMRVNSDIFLLWKDDNYKTRVDFKIHGGHLCEQRKSVRNGFFFIYTQTNLTKNYQEKWKIVRKVSFISDKLPMKKLLHTRQSKMLIRVKSTANILRFHCLEVFTQQSPIPRTCLPQIREVLKGSG